MKISILKTILLSIAIIIAIDTCCTSKEKVFYDPKRDKPCKNTPCTECIDVTNPDNVK